MIQRTLKTGGKAKPWGQTVCSTSDSRINIYHLTCPWFDPGDLTPSREAQLLKIPFLFFFFFFIYSFLNFKNNANCS